MTFREINLTPSEVWSAAVTGCLRQMDSLFRHRGGGHGIKTLGWSENIEGAAGEMAFAQARREYWSCPVGNFHGHDVRGFQVRTTPHRDGHLIVRPDDRDADLFVLVTGRIPRLRICGWMACRDAKVSEFWTVTNDGRPPAWFVPIDRLRDLKGIGL